MAIQVLIILLFKLLSMAEIFILFFVKTRTKSNVDKMYAAKLIFII